MTGVCDLRRGLKLPWPEELTTLYRTMDDLVLPARARERRLACP
jgi:hypothetical protein